MVSVSVIVVTLNEGEWLRRTVDSILSTLDPAGELIVVDDGSIDDSVGFLLAGYQRVVLVRPPKRIGAARARNLGAQHATGDVLVFSDAHVEVEAGWAAPLIEILARPDTGAVSPGISVLESLPIRPTGYGQTWVDASLDVTWLKAKSADPFPVPLLGGGFIALRADVFKAVGGFDPGIRLWGSEDSELSVRLWGFGYQCMVVPSVVIAHRFRTQQPYSITWAHVIYNKLRMAALHLGPERISQVNDFYKDRPEYPIVIEKLAASDVKIRRSQLDSTRVHDDNWFFERFDDNWISANPVSKSH